MARRANAIGLPPLPEGHPIVQVALALDALDDITRGIGGLMVTIEEVPDEKIRFGFDVFDEVEGVLAERLATLQNWIDDFQNIRIAGGY